MQAWDPQFTTRSPMFAPLRSIVGTIGCTAWPLPSDLNTIAGQRDIRSGGAQPLNFAGYTDQTAPHATDYERRIHDEGVMPLRKANWHDLFNALVWFAFPRTKAALNRAHVAQLRAQPDGMRSVRNVKRDALTLFDESGVLVLSSDPAVLQHIRAFEWRSVFCDKREALATTTRFLLFGHGLYEKALRPYVGMTGHALLLQTPAHCDFVNEPGLLAKADAWTANAVHERLAKPRDLSPLPVLGVPGWWDANNEAAFYDNAAYFRPGRMRGTSLGTAVARAGAVR